MARPTLEPVTADTLPEFAAFLHQHLDPSRSPQQWVDGFITPWMPGQPNHGFVIREQGQIVGGIGTFYADRLIEGRAEKVCNITSWCVLDSHRQHSMRLAMAVVAQKGFHFTDFSPTKVVVGMLQFLKFRPLDNQQVAALNLPWPVFDGMTLISDTSTITQRLIGHALKVCEDHLRFPWLQHVLIGRPGAWCHVIYKRRHFKGLPAAEILHVSDRDLMSAGWHRLSRHLLLRGMLGTLVERRVWGPKPWPSVIRSGFNPPLYLSETLQDEQIDYLYSETMAFDL